MISSNSKRDNEKVKEQNNYERDQKLGIKVVDGEKSNTRPKEVKTTVVVNDRKGK